MLSNFHKTLLKAGRGHQTPIKGAHSLQKEVGQNIKDKKRDKRVRDGNPPGVGVVKEKFPNSRKPSHRQVYGEFWNLRGQHNWEKTHTHTHTPQNTHLTTTASKEVAQRLTSTTSEQEMDREALAASSVLRVRT